ncbi:MAG: hypothetical protein N2037_01940 [Acidimicrobiales bacterium]|nr:hypothetical protein [Acidimicrobiales bacterium]
MTEDSNPGNDDADRSVRSQSASGGSSPDQPVEPRDFDVGNSSRSGGTGRSSPDQPLEPLEAEARRREAAVRVNLARVSAVVSVAVGAAVILFGSSLPVGLRNAAVLSAILVFVGAAVLGTVAVAELVRTNCELDDPER